MPPSIEFKDKPSYAGHILLVDDMPVNLRLVIKTPKNHQYQVSCSVDGQTALNSVERMMPDVILLNVRISNMSGCQVCESLTLNPVVCHIPVLFLSAIDTAEDKVRAFELGGVDYITKPFYTKELIKRVEHQIQLAHFQH